MRKAIYCVTKNRDKAGQIVQALMDHGVGREEISLLYEDPRSGNVVVEENRMGAGASTSTVVPEKETKAPEGATTGTVAGGVIGGTLGLLAGIGALAIPGVGPLIAAGPIMGALSGMAVGGGIGLLTGALIGLGIPEYEAKNYEKRLRSGEMLIGVHTGNSAQVDIVKRIFKDHDADDISVIDEGVTPQVRAQDTASDIRVTTDPKADFYQQDEFRDRERL